MNIPIRYRTTDFRYFTQNSEFSIIDIRIQEYRINSYTEIVRTYILLSASV